MKKLIVPALIVLASVTLLTGCLGLALGDSGDSTTIKPQSATVGQQLIDLQKAKDAGVITDADYQAQKTKFLSEK